MARTTPILISALAAACGCSSAPSIKIDLYREIQAQGIAIYFCPPQTAGSCQYAGDPFASQSDLQTSAIIDVPSGHSPVPLALVGDTASTKVCHAVTVDLDPSGQVELNVSVGASGLQVVCTVCASDQAGCTQDGLP